MSLMRWSVVITVGALLSACGTETETKEVAVKAAQIAVDGEWVVTVGKTITLAAKTVDGTDTGYTWSSSDLTVATIDDAGVVTGVAKGVAIITAMGKDSMATASRGVVVEADGGSGGGGTPVVVVTGDYMVEIGRTITLTATTTNATDASYTWSSTDENVATVTTAGVVTGVAAGVAEIVATGADSGKVGRHGVVVPAAAVDPPTPTVAVTGDFTLAVGQESPLTATTQNGTDSGYTWASSDDAVATVDADGKVMAVAAGEATITATGKDSAAAGVLGVIVVEDPFIPPFWDLWLGSGHADKTAEAFNHWNADGEVSASCARCHSQDGFLDWIGADGSAPWSVEKAAPLGTTVTCATCHNETTLELDKVIFPSGVEVTGLGSEARCMQCHQGRNSTVQVDEKIVAAAAADDDTVSDKLSFQNVHYFAAGATLYGGIAMGGYQYEGMSYDSRNRHVNERDTCLGCHDQHSLEVRVDKCAQCHKAVTKVEDLAKVRMFGSTGDYDGDGNTDEGIKEELMGLADVLYAAIKAYGKQMGAPIVYSGSSYPYFFADTNDNGTVDEGEGSYKSWTNNLLRAAYNFQYYQKDPGAFAHNPKYVIQLLNDGITALNATLTTPVPFTGARTDAGHFAGSHEAWRHWDADGEVSASCSKCHSGEGNQFYHEYGVSAPMPLGNGLTCLTCHTELDTYTVRTPDSFTFPNGVTISDPGNKDNLCQTCHSGRESKASVDKAIADNKLSFKNVHYLAAAATLYGSDAHVGYEYDGKTYKGKWTHTGGVSCTGCHAPKETKHTFAIKDNASKCALCHQSTDFESYRLVSTMDYDGDGNTSETLQAELDGLKAALITAMKEVATANGKPIVYDEGRYPYFFLDANGNGQVDTGEGSYKDWTPALLKASFNFQHATKEFGAWAHNFGYAAQLLYDSIEDLKGPAYMTTNNFKRP